MIFLESPALSDPKETWVAWLAQLRTKNQRDVSVKFAIKRAEQIIAELDQYEANEAYA
jgi:hypothetical protein